MKGNARVYLAMAAMFMLYGMSAVALNLAAPLGNVWMQQPGIVGSKTLGMMGNMMSALLSAACIMFLFWTITHLTRRLIVSEGGDYSAGKMTT